MSEAARRTLANLMVRELPRYGRWALAVRDFETPYGKVGFRQLAILWLLRHPVDSSEDVSPTDMAQRLEVRPSVVTRVLARLELGGFIERAVDPGDRRRFQIQITPKGIEVSKHVEELFVQELLAGVADLDDTAIDELTRNVAILSDVVVKLEEGRKNRGIAAGMVVIE